MSIITCNYQKTGQADHDCDRHGMKLSFNVTQKINSNIMSQIRISTIVQT